VQTQQNVLQKLHPPASRLAVAMNRSSTTLIGVWTRLGWNYAAASSEIAPAASYRNCEHDFFAVQGDRAGSALDTPPKRD